MKIVLNGRFLLPGRLEGIGYHTLAVTKILSEELGECQFEVLVDRAVTADFGFGENVKLCVLPPQARHPLLFILWFEWQVKRYLKHSRADLFISFDGFGVLGASCPTILTVHDVAYQYFPKHISRMMRWYYAFFTPRFLREASKVVTVSAFSRDELVKFFGLKREEIGLSCNGLRSIFEERSRMPISGQEKKGYFVVLGAIQPRKNLERVLRAYLLYRERQELDRPSQLYIVGRKGWKYEGLLRVVSGSPFREDIVFTGYLCDVKLKEILSRAKALIYASLYEGFGVPVIEAMSVGTPVITSSISSMPEVAGDAAILVDPYDEEDICAAMLRVDSDREWCEELVEKGYANIDRYDWHSAAKPYKTYIQKMRQSR